MLNNIRNFSKTIFAKFLLVIIIVPFVFWGMGGVFSSGNSNNIAKINNQNISTQNFIDFLNLLKIDNSYIKKNIDKNVLEEFLSQLISQKMLAFEIKNLNLKYTDQMLNKKIRMNKNFEGDDKKFSRIKYEKFLLTSNTSAPEFEFKLRENELKKNLFAYTSGGLKSPFFLINNTYKDQTKKININFINLEKIYKKKNQLTNQEIKIFIEENKDMLKEKNINFNYSIINPKNLNGINDYNDLYFKKIDEIENQITKGSTYNEIIKKYELKSNYKENISINEVNKKNDSKEFYEKILENSNKNKINLLDENEYYVLYEITKVNEIIPSLNEKNFKEKISNLLLNKSKFEFNRKLIKEITDKKFSQTNFEKLSKSNLIEIENYQINSIRDSKKFSIESVKFLYSKLKGEFTLISDDKQNIFLVKIVDIIENNISNTDKDFKNYENQANIIIRDQLYGSYDAFLNMKYKVTVNQKTLDRVKNYFK